MQITISFSGNKFPPAFGYLEVWTICEAVNNENPAWNVAFQFNSNSNFSFSSFIATTEQLSDAINAKLLVFQGPKQLPAFSFPLTQSVKLDQNNKIVLAKFD